MICMTVRSSQPAHLPWSIDHFLHEHAIALGQAIDFATWKNYALNSYLEFIRIHNFEVDPTEDTLSYFVVFMSYHIKPSSVNTYLSGICQQLEPFFPGVRTAQKSKLVERTLCSCKRMRGQPITRKLPLSIDNLCVIYTSIHLSTDHDDKLFLAQLFTGFFALLCLGKLTYPDDASLHDPQKLSRRNSVSLTE